MNVLLLTHRLPYAPNRGDRIRAYHLVRALAARHDLSLLSLAHDEEEAAQTPALREACAACEVVLAPRLANLARGFMSLAGAKPLTHSLLSAPGVVPALRRLVSQRRPDVVIAYCSGMAQYVFQDPLAGLPFVLDMVDVDSEKWRARARTAGVPMRWIYAREQRTLASFEQRVTCAAATALVANERERHALAAMAREADIRVVANGIDARWFAPLSPPVVSSTVVFTGVMDYAPNVQAVVWFATEVWPKVLAARPDARFLIVGANPTSAVKALAGASVQVTGAVADTRPFLWKAAAGVAPLLTARGIQNKVLEAVAAGLPTTVTPVVAEGLPPEVMPAVAVAATAADFARAVVGDLARSPDARRAHAGSARLGPLSWPGRLAALDDILIAAAAAPRTLKTL